MVTNYVSLEQIVQDIMTEADGGGMRLCDFQTLLFEKMPETTEWPWIFNKLPSSIAPHISVDYGQLDRRMTFEDRDHLNRKSNNYVHSMNPNDAKLRENVMQQFYRSRTDKLPLDVSSRRLVVVLT